MASEKKKRSLAAPMKIVSALIYFSLIGVVYYGMDHYVYDGFGKAVPYIIMGVFAVMGIVRIIDFINSVRAQRAISRCEQANSELGSNDLNGDDIF